MTRLVNFIMDHSEQALIVVFVAVFAMIATYLIYWITNKNRFTKYILGFVLTFIGLYSLISGLENFTRPEGVDLVARAIIIGVAGLVSVCFALIIGVLNKDKGKKKLKRKYKRIKRNTNE